MRVVRGAGGNWDEKNRLKFSEEIFGHVNKIY